MRYKVKAIVGLYQCVSAIPSVFNVVAPSGIDGYAEWLSLIEVDDFGADLVVEVRLRQDRCGAVRRRDGVGQGWASIGPTVPTM